MSRAVPPSPAGFPGALRRHLNARRHPSPRTARARSRRWAAFSAAGGPEVGLGARRLQRPPGAPQGRRHRTVAQALGSKPNRQCTETDRFGWIRRSASGGTDLEIGRSAGGLVGPIPAWRLSGGWNLRGDIRAGIALRQFSTQVRHRAASELFSKTDARHAASPAGLRPRWPLARASPPLRSGRRAPGYYRRGMGDGVDAPDGIDVPEWRC